MLASNAPGERKEHRLVLALGCRVVLEDIAPKALDLPVCGEGDHCVLTIGVRVERPLHVDVVPALDFSPALVAGEHRPLKAQSLEERRQSLLSIEDEPLSVPLDGRRSTLERALLEADAIAPGPEHHDGTYRVSEGDAREQAANAIVFPHPPSLEIGQLRTPVRSLPEQRSERFLLDVVPRDIHRVPSTVVAPRSALTLSVPPPGDQHLVGEPSRRGNAEVSARKLTLSVRGRSANTPEAAPGSARTARRSASGWSPT